MNAREFILQNIDKTTKGGNFAGEGTLLRLPYPYTTPCVSETFQEMYYWDTYFTHKCLLVTGRENQALNNINNFYYMVQTYGKIPNGNREHFLNRSQPPFFGLMIKDLCESFPELLEKKQRFQMLRAEYDFWNNFRKTENGLNRYYTEYTKEECTNPDFFADYEHRVGRTVEHSEDMGRSIAAECESGMDFSPRFANGCIFYNPVDLNCLLYADECLLAEWAEEEIVSEYYRAKAEKRKATMERTMRAKNGVFYDYDYVSGKRTDVLSFASFFPFFVGLSDDMSAFDFVLAGLERACGIVACKTDSRIFQWAEPNSWAPGNYLAFAAALALNRNEDARRIAEKYVAAIDGIYAKTGELWEKYNGETGGMEGLSEYAAPKMLGWTAGVYIAFDDYLKKYKEEKIINE